MNFTYKFVKFFQLSLHQTTFEFALLTLLMVNATNLMSKSFYSWLQGDRSFAIKFLISAVIIVASGAVWLVFN